MGHHSHHHDLKGKMLLSVILNVTITVVEVVGGLLSGSLALLGDSFHNLSDSMSILASYAAIRIKERKRNRKYTFGYGRAEILVSFINSAFLIGVVMLLLVESYRRFTSPKPIDTSIMLPVALVGLIANLLSVLLLHEHAGESMNVRSAYLHLMGDTLSSLAVFLGGILIRLYSITWVDPLVTVLISLYLLRGAYGILKESVEVLMEAAPDIDLDAVRREIEAIPNVRDAHHFHVWRVGDKEVALECHVSLPDMSLREAQKIIDEIERRLRKFGIGHVTVQLEVDRCADRGLVYGEGRCGGQG